MAFGSSGSSARSSTNRAHWNFLHLPRGDGDRGERARAAEQPTADRALCAARNGSQERRAAVAGARLDCGADLTLPPRRLVGARRGDRAVEWQRLDPLPAEVGVPLLRRGRGAVLQAGGERVDGDDDLNAPPVAPRPGRSPQARASLATLTRLQTHVYRHVDTATTTSSARTNIELASPPEKYLSRFRVPPRLKPNQIHPARGRPPRLRPAIPDHSMHPRASR